MQVQYSSIRTISLSVISTFLHLNMINMAVSWMKNAKISIFTKFPGIFAGIMRKTNFRELSGIPGGMIQASGVSNIRLNATNTTKEDDLVDATVVLISIRDHLRCRSLIYFCNQPECRANYGAHSRNKTIIICYE